MTLSDDTEMAENDEVMDDDSPDPDDVDLNTVADANDATAPTRPAELPPLPYHDQAVQDNGEDVLL